VTQALSVNGIRIELIDRGQGNPLLFLHPGIGLDPDAPVIERLASRMRVLAPTHPGFGASEAKVSIELFNLLAVCRGIRRANVPLPLRMSARSA